MLYLESPESMKWLAEVHTSIATGYACAIIHGTEERPDRIELFYAKDAHCEPTILFSNENGELAFVQWGNPLPPNPQGNTTRSP